MAESNIGAIILRIELLRKSSKVRYSVYEGNHHDSTRFLLYGGLDNQHSVSAVPSTPIRMELSC